MPGIRKLLLKHIFYQTQKEIICKCQSEWERLLKCSLTLHVITLKSIVTWQFFAAFITSLSLFLKGQYLVSPSELSWLSEFGMLGVLNLFFVLWNVLVGLTLPD